LGADRSDTWDGGGDDSSDGEGIGMKITVELDLDATFHERDNGDLLLEVLTFPGCNQNLLPFLSVNEQQRAQEALREQCDTKLMLASQEAAERREMAGDARRERLRDDRLSGDAL
jgi:hypothetical protein